MARPTSQSPKDPLIEKLKGVLPVLREERLYSLNEPAELLEFIRSIPDFNKVNTYQGQALAEALDASLATYLKRSIPVPQTKLFLEKWITERGEEWAAGLFIRFRYLNLPDRTRGIRSNVVNLLHNQEEVEKHLPVNYPHRVAILHQIRQVAEKCIGPGKLMASNYKRLNENGVAVLAEAIRQLVGIEKHQVRGQAIYPPILAQDFSLRLPRRELVEQVIKLLISPTTEGDFPRLVGLTGPPGAGKTTLAEMIMGELADRLEETEGIRPGGVKFSLSTLVPKNNKDNLEKHQLLGLGAEIGIVLDEKEPTRNLRLELTNSLAGGSFILILDDLYNSTELRNLVVGNKQTYVLAISNRRETVSPLIPDHRIIKVGFFDAEEWCNGLARYNQKWAEADFRNYGLELGQLLDYCPLALEPVANTAMLVGPAQYLARLQQAEPVAFGRMLSSKLPRKLKPSLDINYEYLSTEDQLCYRALGTWGVAWQETEEIYYDVTFSEQAAHALWGSVQKSDWTCGLTYASLLELVKAGLLKKQENAYSLHRLFLEDAIQRWQAESDEQTRRQAEFWYRKLPWWPELESWFSISFILLTILLWFLLTIVNLFLLESFRLLTLILLAVIMIYIAYPGIRDLQEIQQKQALNYLRRKTDTVALVLLELQRAKARLNVDNYGMMKKLQEVEKRAIRLVETGLGIVVLIIILPGGLFLYRTTFNLNWIENGPELGKWRNVIVGSLYFVLTIGTGFTSVGLMLRSKLLSLPSKLRNRLREQST